MGRSMSGMVVFIFCWLWLVLMLEDVGQIGGEFECCPNRDFGAA